MDAQIPVTAAMLYDLVHCPHRVAMDQFANTGDRDTVSPFVQLLWERGTAFEREVIRELAVPFLDLSSYSENERERLTSEAMSRGEPLIYSGRISHGDLLGDPDLLRKTSSGYIAGEIKSGSGEEAGDDEGDGKPKLHYAVQLALYLDILERKGLSGGRYAFIWDVHGEEIIYDFDAEVGVRNPTTLWTRYSEYVGRARLIVTKIETTLPAYSATCKNCVWYSACIEILENTNDLTLLPQLGRSKRDAMLPHVANVRDFAEINPEAFIQGKKTVFAGIGPDSLRKFHARALLVSTKNAQPYLTAPISFPTSTHELFFDIEVDPMRDICYLHGFVERIGGSADQERFVYFLAEAPTAEHEKEAFFGAWNYMKELPAAAIYYYSKYERTIYRKLQAKYPDVCSAEEVEALFDPSRSVDLYFDVVQKVTEWPTRDYSLKTLAKFLGFSWRDTHPSGAASIEWFNRWIESGDTEIRQRILDYNEDDCRATRVLLDGVRTLSIA